jgi:hypothetical protein
MLPLATHLEKIVKLFAHALRVGNRARRNARDALGCGRGELQQANDFLRVSAKQSVVDWGVARVEKAVGNQKRYRFDVLATHRCNLDMLL